MIDKPERRCKTSLDCYPCVGQSVYANWSLPPKVATMTPPLSVTMRLVPLCIGPRRHNDSGPVKPNSGIDLHQVAAHGAGRRRPLRAARCDRPYDSSMPSPCRFPPPWSIEEQEACFTVRDENGQVLARRGCKGLRTIVSWLVSICG
jgi:hypothetical protein